MDKYFENKIRDANTLNELAEPLEELLGPQYNVWSDGRLMIQKALVDIVCGVRIEINPREHPPPHFHIKGDGFSATFSIETGNLLNGSPTQRQIRLIKWWFDRSKLKLIETWDDTRPTDCPVGPIITDETE